MLGYCSGFYTLAMAKRYSVLNDVCSMNKPNKVCEALLVQTPSHLLVRWLDCYNKCLASSYVLFVFVNKKIYMSTHVEHCQRPNKYHLRA
jgi:hypothetical protein